VNEKGHHTGAADDKGDVQMFSRILTGLTLTSALLLTGMHLHAAAKPGAALDGGAILQKADSYRNFKEQRFSFDLEMINFKPGKSPESFNLRVEIKDSHHSLVVYKSPASERGKAVLMQNRDLWFHTPNNKNPIRITAQQRFLGEASNGDVATTDFYGDYEAKSAASVQADGIACYKLDLLPKAGAIATYGKIELWVKASDNAPYKASFYGSSGKLLKHAFYKKYEKLPSTGNKPQLVEIEISSPTNAAQKTVMRYSNFKAEDLPDTHFETNYLKRVE
jgi:hypothetical protein